jgi:acetyltransferase
VLDYAQAKHIGFSKFISFGNKADINEIDLLYYLKDDPHTSVILIYLEEITDGPGAHTHRSTDNRGKRQTDIGTQIRTYGRRRFGGCLTHRSLAGRDEICDAAFKQAGIIRCADIEEMFNNAIALTYQPLPRNNRIAIVTNAGGPGVLTTDAAIQQGLRLAKFSDATTALFRKSLPKTANIKNPVDVIGDARADRYNLALSSVLKDEDVDGALVILTPQSMTDIETIAREVCNVSSQYDKPIYASFMVKRMWQRESISSSGIASHITSCLNRCVGLSRLRIAFRTSGKHEPLAAWFKVADSKVHRILSVAVEAGRSVLLEHEASQILRLYGLPVLKWVGKVGRGGCGT